MQLPGLDNALNWDIPERLNMAAQCLAGPPDSVAIIDLRERERHDVTRAALAERVDAVAAHLRERVQPGDRIGVLLDTFHLNIEEKNLEQAIAASADKLVHFHVSDNDRGVPGSGHVPWGQVRAGLDQAGYDGWITAEMFVIAGNPASADLNIWRPIEPDAQQAAAQALDFMKATFG